MQRFFTVAVMIVGLVACSVDRFEAKSGGKQGADAVAPFNPGPEPSIFDFESECGIPKANLENPDLPLVQGSFQSFPILLEGSQLIANFRVALVANVVVSSGGGTGRQTQEISVLEANGSASLPIGSLLPGPLGVLAQLGLPAVINSTVKSKAEEAARKQSGVTETTSLALKDWFKLTNGSNPEFATVLCATSGLKSSTITREGQTGTVEYSPALVSGVNPFAPVTRMQQEFGAGRTFNVTADVKSSVDGMVAGLHQGTVTIRSVAPTLDVSGQSVRGDIAWEFVHDFPGGAFTVGLPKRQVFYIDTTAKAFSAIVNESDKPDETTKKPLPPVVLIRK